jgi:hypothetical protein
MADDGGAETSERVDEPTPNGGVYSIANFMDAGGSPCPKSDAVAMEILEFDGADQCVGRTYLTKGGTDAEAGAEVFGDGTAEEPPPGGAVDA